MIDMATAYDILGVKATATDREIHIAHRKLSAAAHPDRGCSDAQYKLIQRAFALIGTPDARARYDERLRNKAIAHELTRTDGARMYTHCNVHGSQKWVGHVRCKECNAVTRAYLVVDSDTPLTMLLRGTLDLLGANVATEKSLFLREIVCSGCKIQFGMSPMRGKGFALELACAKCAAGGSGA